MLADEVPTQVNTPVASDAEAGEATEESKAAAGLLKRQRSSSVASTPRSPSGRITRARAKAGKADSSPQPGPSGITPPRPKRRRKLPSMLADAVPLESVEDDEPPVSTQQDEDGTDESMVED
ncbi:hypothetical protein EWM64_g5655 [Hericium alpestre]|uniref:Uncharacterized protein n=1 Tax=Hericium alpestre TaxID=135208 RepID=A0A4Y9ZWB7_9AGAM|nr:hypothetical protein EWM64_g5655 [Hericium alpestre]